MEKKNKRILVLAGGADQIALIKELKRRGHTTILIDYFENPPAKSFADKHIVASTLDVEKVKQIAVEECVDLVCTACTDQALLTVANVSESLGLPCYLSYQTGLNVTNKAYMKKVLVANNIPTAKYIITDTIDVSNRLAAFSFPVVVKPVDCNSSKGVKRVDSEIDISRYLKDAINCSRTNSAVIEEFKQGTEISADFYVEGTKVKFLSATKSFKIKDENSFTILGSEYPAINPLQEAAITRVACQIVEAFGLKDTPLLIQFIVNGSDVNVIEFSARMGGGSKYKLIEILSGVNIMSKYVDLILGGKPTVSPAKRVDFCKMVYVYCNPGVLKEICGLHELKSQNIIDDYFIYKTVGMTFEKTETSGDRAAGFLVTADSKETLEKKIKEANSAIQVLNDRDIDIMKHNLIEP